MIIRRSRGVDLQAILRIERQAMAAPWSEPQVTAELSACNALAWVAEADDDVRGYAFFRVCPPESELLRIAVAPSWRRRGAGRYLLAEALCFLQYQQGCACCFLEVRAANDEAQQLYRQAGFAHIARRKAYYRHPIEDAIVLRKDLSTPMEDCREYAQRY